ncbi:hypothetical protein [Sulfitobacter sp. EhC04]|uniref:hypothetical protein n=1 Tax=Sulfitobacter sp. EhC04 TaxID=1849168 RepID=UPI0013BE91F0|nr:hypothetical protein [Sulfitobacter sp. EhC04]
MNPIWLLRMSKWAHNPPSAKRVKLVFAAIALALIIFGIEWMGWWPDWATAERVPRRF